MQREARQEREALRERKLLVYIYTHTYISNTYMEECLSVCPKPEISKKFLTVRRMHVLRCNVTCMRMRRIRAKLSSRILLRTLFWKSMRRE